MARGGAEQAAVSDSDRYKWIALSNTTLSMTMATIDSSIVIIAMPAIFRGIKLNPTAPGFRRRHADGQLRRDPD